MLPALSRCRVQEGILVNIYQVDSPRGLLSQTLTNTDVILLIDGPYRLLLASCVRALSLTRCSFAYPFRKLGGHGRPQFPDGQAQPKGKCTFSARRYLLGLPLGLKPVFL